MFDECANGGRTGVDLAEVEGGYYLQKGHRLGNCSKMFAVPR